MTAGGHRPAATPRPDTPGQHSETDASAKASVSAQIRPLVGG